MLIVKKQAIFQRWRYQPNANSRDLPLDFLRGYLVFVMTIDHLNTFPAWTRMFTGAARLWVSAGIGFVLISGFVLGMLYRERVPERGWGWSIRQIGKRAWQLYLLGAAGRLVLTTSDYILRLGWDRPSNLPTEYWQIVRGALFQAQFGFGYLDLLPLYALLLPLGLAAVYFLREGKWYWVVLVSLYIWQARRLDPAAFQILRIGFPAFTWQAPFILGVVVGFYRREIGRWRAQLPLADWLISAILISSALVFLFISYQVTFHDLWPQVAWDSINKLWFEKLAMDPGRLIGAFLVFAGLYELIGRFWKIWQWLLGWLMLPLGQNALIAYIAQGILSYLISRLPGYPFPGHDPSLMGFIHLAAVLLVWFLTGLIAQWLQDRARIKVPSTAVSQT